MYAARPDTKSRAVVAREIRLSGRYSVEVSSIPMAGAARPMGSRLVPVLAPLRLPTASLLDSRGESALRQAASRAYRLLISRRAFVASVVSHEAWMEGEVTGKRAWLRWPARSHAAFRLFAGLLVGS